MSRLIDLSNLNAPLQVPKLNKLYARLVSTPSTGTMSIFVDSNGIVLPVGAQFDHVLQTNGHFSYSTGASDSKLVIDDSGKFQINGCIDLKLISGTRFQVQLVKNGIPVNSTITFPVNPSEVYFSVNLKEYDVNISSGDYIDIRLNKYDGPSVSTELFKINIEMVEK
jgi:hypothetical protein